MTGFCLKCFTINPTTVLSHYLPYVNLYVARNSWNARSTCTHSCPCGRTVLAPWWCNWRSWKGLEDAVVSQSPQWGCEAGTSRSSLTRLVSYWLWHLKIKLIDTMIYSCGTGPNVFIKVSINRCWCLFTPEIHWLVLHVTLSGDI